MLHPHISGKTMAQRATLGFLTAIIAATALVAPGAHADELSWGVSPGGDEERSSFSYDAEPGTRFADSFEITNYGSEEISLAVYPADGATSSNGSLELSANTEAATGIGSWVDVVDPKVTLAPGEEISVDFTVEIPQDVTPGDYLGGLVTSYVDTSASTVVVDRRLATQLAVRVGGEGAVDLDISEVQAHAPIAWNPFAPVEATVGATVGNEGNLRARGSYTVKISGPFGLGATSQTYNAEELLPGSTVAIEQRVPGLWPALWQHVDITLDAEGLDSLPAGTTAAAATFWTIPAGWILLVLVVIATAIVLGVRRARNWEYEDEPEEPEMAVSK